MQEFITPPNHKGFSAKKLFDENGKIKWGAIAYIEKGGGGPEGNHTHNDNHIFIVVDGEGSVYAADVKEVKELMKKVCRSEVLTGHTNGFSRNTSTPYNLNPVCKLSFQQSY